MPTYVSDEEVFGRAQQYVPEEEVFGQETPETVPEGPAKSEPAGRDAAVVELRKRKSVLESIRKCLG